MPLSPAPSAASSAAAAARTFRVSTTPSGGGIGTNHKKHIFIHAVACVTFSCISISAAGEALSTTANTTGSTAGYISLCAVAAATAFLNQCMASCQWRCLAGLQPNPQQRKVQADDCALVLLSILVPCILLLLDFNPLPVSDNRQGNDFMMLGFLLRLGVAMDLPPKHCFVQFLLTFPFFMFLDYHRQQEHPSPYSGSLPHNLSRHAGSLTQALDGQPAFFNYFLSRGVFILLLGLLGHCTFVALSMKREQAARKQAREEETRTSSSGVSQCTEHSAPEACAAVPELSCLPLKTFRLSGLFLVMEPLLQQLELGLYYLGEMVSEELVMALVCIPVGLWYVSFALLSRILPKWVSISSVAADEWMVVLSIFFVMGRHSCQVDMLPFISHLQGQLTRSQDILADILPSHMLAPLLNTGKQAGGDGAEAKQLGDDNSQHPPAPSVHTQVEFSEPSFSPLNTLSSMFHEYSSENSIMNKLGRHSLEAVRSARSICSLHLQPSPSKTSQSHLSPPPSKLTESHECVSIFFSDICDFGSWVHLLPAATVMQTLDDLYSRLDDIIIREMPGLYKVETIGDGYMVAANLMTKDEHHAATILSFALRAQEEASKVPRPDKQDGSSLQLRIGVHSGPAVSGSVGNLRRNFCLFGNTINMASRTQTSCPPGCIQITEACHQLAQAQVSERVVFKDRGHVSVKGASKPLHMYLVMTREMLAMSRCLKAAGVEF